MGNVHSKGFAYQVVAWLALVAIVVLALALRWPGIDNRPFHADEATGARITAERMEGASYRFDPTHYHGPLLSSTAAWGSRLRGETDWASLRTSTLRSVTLVFGMLAVVLAAAVILPTSLTAALLAASFVATSPLLVYYSTMFIHEPLFVGCTALAAVGLVRMKRKTLAWAVLAGLGIGLMAATRQTFVFTLFAWVCAGVVLCLSGFFNSERTRRWGLIKALLPPLAVAGTLAFLIVVIAYWSESAGLFGFLELVKTYFVYETVAGHEKPLSWFFQLMIWPKNAGGVWWSEAGLALLALLLFVPGQATPVRRLGLFFLLSAGVLFVMHSLIAYKTPWLMSSAWWHLCLAAACGSLQLLGQARWLLKGVGIALVIAVLLFQIHQSRHATGRLVNDPRNPYAYVPTLSQVESLPRFLTELLAYAPADADSQLIPVLGRNYWPLPWYLRSFDRVGYWPDGHPQAQNLPLLLVMPGQFELLREELAATHVWLPRALRDGFVMHIAIEQKLWDLYLYDE